MAVTKQIEIPDGCENTLDHALMHLNSAYKSIEGKDWAQALHDIGLAEAIVKNVREMLNND